MTEDKQIVNPAISLQQGPVNAQAIFDKGVQLYLAGQHGEALSPFKETADSYPSAALFLGRMHEIGYGVKVDFKQSAAFYKKAALGFFHVLVDQGDTETLSDLVSYYRAAQDYRRMLEYFQKMIKQGHPKAMVLASPNYGGFVEPELLKQSAFEQGAVLHSIPRYQEARQLFEPIAKNCPPAALCLGLMYEEGQGVVRNSIRATIYYKMAASGFAKKLGEQKGHKEPYGLDQYYATQQLSSDAISSSEEQTPTQTDQPGMVAVSTAVAPPIEMAENSVLPAEISAATNQNMQPVKQESLEPVTFIFSSEDQTKDSKSGHPTLPLRPKADYKASQIFFTEGLVLYCQAEYSQALARFEQVNYERFPVVCICLSLLYQEVEGVSHDMQKSAYWFEEAKKHLGWFQRLEKKRQKTAEDYYCLGLYYQFLAGKDKRKQAVDCYKKAVKFVPAEANYRLGIYYVEKKNAGEARIYLEKAAAQEHKPAIVVFEKLLQENPQLCLTNTAVNSVGIGVSSSHDVEPAGQVVAASSSSIDNTAELGHEITSSIQGMNETNLPEIGEASIQRADNQDIAVDSDLALTDISLPSQLEAEVMSEFEPVSVTAETKVTKPAVSTKPKKPEDHFNEGFNLYLQARLPEALPSFLLAAEGNYPSSYPFLCALYAGGPNGAAHDTDESKKYGEKAKQERQRLKKTSKENANATKQCYIAFYYHLVECNENQAIVWYEKAAESNKQAEQMLKRINASKNKSLQNPIKLDGKEERGGHNLPNDRSRMEDLSAKIIQSVFAGRDQEAKQYAAQGLAALRSTKRQSAPYPLRSKQVQKSSMPTVAVRSVSQENGDTFTQAEEIMKQGKCCLVLGQYKTARNLFEQIAGPDCPQTYLYLGKIYRMGFGVPRNVEQSNINYQKAQAIIALFKQDSDNPRERFYLGVYHTDVTKDHKQAAEHFSFADVHGDIDATYLLALCYLVDTLGVKKNPKEAVRLLQKAIARGHPNARYELAMYYNIKEPKKAEEEFRKGIALQESMSSCGLAVLYLKRATKDLKKIAELFEAAATQGDAIAQYHIGECYLTGRGVTEDISAAIKWFTPAAEQGHAKVQFELGKIHLRSIGNKKPNYKEAIKWLKLAAVQWHDEASFELGMIYFERTDGEEPDYIEAKKWFELAARYGSIEAPLYLQKCQAKINALERDKTKSEDKATEAEGSFPDSSIQLIGQVKPESPSFSSGTGFLLPPVELSPEQVEGLLFQMLESNVKTSYGPGPRGLSLRMFSPSSSSSNGAAQNCVDKFIVGDGKQAKSESNGAVVQSSVTVKTNSAQSLASNGSTGFFKQGKKSKGQKKSSGALPEIRNYGSCS